MGEVRGWVLRGNEGGFEWRLRRRGEVCKKWRL